MAYRKGDGRMPGMETAKSVQSHPVQNELQYHRGTEKGQHEQDEAGQRIAHRGATAPAAVTPPPKQQGEDKPGQDGEHGLVFGIRIRRRSR